MTRSISSVLRMSASGSRAGGKQCIKGSPETGVGGLRPARFDRSRKNKKTSNKEWKSPQEPDAKVAKMKDGRTHLAHKAEHGVDMDTGAIVSVTVQDASDGDTATLPETLIMAAEQVEAVQPKGAGVEEVVADKGYVCEPPACARAAGSSPATPPGRGGGAYFRAHV